MTDQKKIGYIYSDNLRFQCDRLPMMLNRASVVQDLINSYGILTNKKILVVQSLDASEEDLKQFHSSSYVEFLKKVNMMEEFDEYDKELDEFGLGYDCPILRNNYDFVRVLAGASLTAATLLVKNVCHITINWFGGWHHAQRDSAGGFCYVNDIVLAIQRLREKFGKVLYLDLDIHHGDGVQNAFEYSRRILTLSFHKLTPGFYPGTGRLEDIGSGNGKYYTINVPFKEGVGNETYIKVFSNVFPKILDVFKPDALVVQCGADSLCGDGIGESNLTLNTIEYCVKRVLDYNKPTLFCGGGGYNFANTARLWTHLTSIIIGEELDPDIPDCSEYFTRYQPTYELKIAPSYQKDYNTEEYTTELITTILTYCDVIQEQNKSI